jgi:1-acyl-sn-glycerol-3-phosphate acyltransferase
MPKSVLGNDPFTTAAVPTEKSVPRASEKKKAPKVEKKTAVKAGSDKKPLKAAVEKKSKKPVVAKVTLKPSKPQEAKSEKSTTTKSAAKPDPRPEAIVHQQAEVAQPETINTEKSEKPIQTAQAARPEPDFFSGVEVSPRAIGGGDPDLLKLMRPDHFSIGEEFGSDPSFRERIRPVLQFFYRFYWRVTVKGIENLPKDGRAVLVCNHAGILPFDALMLAQAIQREAGRDAWPLIEDFFYHAPILGPLLSRAGCVRACQENAQRLLAQENLVAVFPEGIKGIVKSYRKRYRLQRFGRGGFVKLCLQTDSAAVPVAIVGSEEAHPLMANIGSLAKLLDLPFFPITPLFPLLGPFGLLPLPSKWTIVIGEPLYVNQFGPEAASDRVAINRLSNQVKSHIQKMIDMELGLQHSRWR